MTDWTVTWVEETDSTNQALKERRDAPHGTVLAARRQTHGRGRLGRSFLSPEGGLYLSALLRPNCPPGELMHLTAMVAVAVRRAVASFGVEPEIKWVNDLVCQGKKLCGILVEWSGSAAIIGVGINCNATDFPPEIASTATSLRLLTGHETDIAALAEAVAEALREMDSVLLSGREAYLAEYPAHCVTLGKPVRLLQSGKEPREAFALGLDENAGLLVRFADGHTETVQSGEASIRSFTGYAHTEF